MTSVENVAWPEFAWHRREAIGICRRALATVGLQIQIQTSIGARDNVTAMCTLEGMSPIGFFVRRGEPDLSVFAGLTTSSVEEAARIQSEGTSRYRIPFYRNGKDVEIRFPLCLGLVTVESIKLAVHSVWSACSWAAQSSGLTPLIPSFEAPVFELAPVAKHLHGELLGQGFNCSQRQLAAGVWAITYTTPKKPDYEMGIVFDPSRSLVFSTAGTATTSPASEKTVEHCHKIAFRHSVVWETHGQGVQFHYPFPPSRVDENSLKVILMRPLLAVTQFRQAQIPSER